MWENQVFVQAKGSLMTVTLTATEQYTGKPEKQNQTIADDPPDSVTMCIPRVY